MVYVLKPHALAMALEMDFTEPTPMSYGQGEPLKATTPMDE